MSKINKDQEARARKLMAKHRKERAFVHLPTGKVAFFKRNLPQGATDAEIAEVLTDEAAIKAVTTQERQELEEAQAALLESNRLQDERATQLNERETIVTSREQELEQLGQSLEEKAEALAKDAEALKTREEAVKVKEKELTVKAGQLTKRENALKKNTPSP